MEATKAEYQELLTMYQADTGLGAVSNQYRDILLDIKQVKSELSNAEKGSNLFYNLTDELAGLKQMKEGMASVFQTTRAGDIGSSRVEGLVAEKQIAEQLTVLKEQERSREQNALATQLGALHQLEVAYSGLMAFKQADFATVDKATASYKRQLEYVTKIKGVLGSGGGVSQIQQGIEERQDINKQRGTNTTATSKLLEAINKLKKDETASIAATDASKVTMSTLSTGLLQIAAGVVTKDSEVLPDQKFGADVFETPAKLWEAVGNRLEVVIGAISGSYQNNLDVLYGSGEAVTYPQVNLDKYEKLDNPLQDLKALQESAREAVKSVDGAAQFAEDLSKIKLRSPDAREALATDVESLDAKGAIDYSELLAKLTPFEQLIISAKQSDIVKDVTDALKAQADARAKVDAVQSKKVGIGEKYKDLNLNAVDKDTGIQTGSLNIKEMFALGLADMSTILAHNLKSQVQLPRTVVADNGGTVEGNVVNHNTFNVLSPDKTIQQQVKALEPGITRLQRRAALQKN